MLLAKYTSDWIKQFQSIKAKIENVLGENAYTIEHVGSTSVPQLDAKPIIDIDIIYHSPDDFDKIKAGLEKLGYVHHGNQGIADREVFKRNQKNLDHVLDTIQHHLYVCPHDSAALERHILTRDFMRKNEWARLQYQELKYEMAARAKQDRKTYQALKELHINSLLDAMVEKERIEKGKM